MGDATDHASLYSERANMTQIDLAHAAHVSVDLIKSIENGSMPFGKVDLEKAFCIGRALRIDVEDFIYSGKQI